MGRLLLDGPGHPLRNMAVDRALFEVGEGTILRLYAWSPAGLSIGRFQEEPEGVASDLVLVRRITGGGAIEHREELTFSISGPSDRDPLDRSARSTYRIVNDLVIEALRVAGCEAQARGAGEERKGCGRSMPFLCFERSSPFDLVVGSEKIVGTAQRRGRDRCLIHGSIRLEGWGGRLEADRLGRNLVAGLEARIGRSLVPGSLTGAEEAAVRRFLATSMATGPSSP